MEAESSVFPASVVGSDEAVGFAHQGGGREQIMEAESVVGSDEAVERMPSPAYKNLQRVHWLAVHSGHRITINGLYTAGILADGCHSVVCSGNVVVTYMHLSTRCRQHALAKFFRHMPGCTSARIVEAINDKTLVCTSEFLDLVKHLWNGTFTSEGAALGLLSKHLKPPTTTTQQSLTRKLTAENSELHRRIAAMQWDSLVMEQRLQAAQRYCANVPRH